MAVATKARMPFYYISYRTNYTMCVPNIITKEASLYAKATLKLEKNNLLGSYVQVFVAGYASAGKTTLRFFVVKLLHY